MSKLMSLVKLKPNKRSTIMNKLLDQFNEMQSKPIFELEDSNGDLKVYTIQANEAGLQVLYTNIFQPWDDIFSLDEHLQALVEECWQERIT